MTGQTTDFGELMARVREGSQEAAWELVALYGPFVVRSVRKRLPEDLRRAFDSGDFVQEAWLTFFRHPSRVSRLETPGEFIGLMTAAAANKVREEVRGRLRYEKHNVNRERAHDSAIARQAGHDATASQMAIAREEWFRMIRSKPPHHQEVVRLRLLGYSRVEIAAQLDMHEGSVRRILRNILREDVL